ncbi:hypothetical protein MAR_034461, partial [Mya arenaria]
VASNYPVDSFKIQLYTRTTTDKLQKARRRTWSWYKTCTGTSWSFLIDFTMCQHIPSQFRLDESENSTSQPVLFNLLN